MNTEPRTRLVSGALRRELVVLDHPRFPHAHASTIVRTQDGLVVAWFAGRREADPGTRILFSDRSPGGRWSDPEVLAGPPGPSWNPVLDHATDGTTTLYLKTGPDPGTWITWTTTRVGGSWRTVRPLVPGPDGDGGRGPSRNHVIRFRDLLLAPGSDERTRPWRSFVDVQDDLGWSRHDVPVASREAAASVIQPALAVVGERVVALLRSDAGRVFISRSHDGRTWSPAEPTPLPSNNSGLDAVALPDGRLVAALNPVATSWGVRCPLVLSVSADAGSTWRDGPVVEDGITPPAPGVAAGGFTGGEAYDRDLGGAHEYSYPSLALDDDELVITYTWQRRGIVCARVSLTDLSCPSHVQGRTR